EIVFARKTPLANQITAVFDPYWKDNKFVTEIAGPELETVKQAFISMETRKEALQNANEGRQSAAAAAATTSHPFQLLPAFPVFPPKPISKKRYLQPNEIQELSLALALKIYISGCRPDFLVALWRGGAAVGLYVQGYLAHLGVKCDHVAIRTSSYDNKQSQRKEVQIHAIGHLKE